MSAFCHSVSTLCLSALFGVVCQLSLVIFPYTSENKQVRVGSISGCVLFPATLLYGWGYTQFVCCLLGSKTRRVSSRGRDSREHLPMRMLYYQRVLLRGSLHQRSSWCQPCFRRDRPATALAGIADKTTPVPAALDATPVFIRGGGCGGCWWAFEKHIVCTTILWIISLWSPCLGSGLIVLFPAAFCSAPARHAPRSVSMPVISRSGPTAAETRRRLRTRGSKHGSGGWVGDWLALSPPVFPRSSGFRTTGSDGGCAQRGYFWPAVHEIPRVVAQDQRVLPEGKPASDAQGHAALA